jgi:gas vesicle protein
VINEKKQHNHEAMKTALLIMSAGMAGATFALLYAPRSGKKTRRAIQGASQNLAQRAENLQEEFCERVENLVEDARSLAEQGIDKGIGLTDQVHKDLLASLQGSQELISNQIERARELVRQ